MLTNWRDWCRLCAKNDESGINIYFKLESDTDLSETLQKYFNLSITPYDDGPRNICQNCFQFIVRLKKFADKCAKSDLMFSELLYGRINVDIPEENEIQAIRMKFGICDDEEKYGDFVINYVENEGVQALKIDQVTDTEDLVSFSTLEEHNVKQEILVQECFESVGKQPKQDYNEIVIHEGVDLEKEDEVFILPIVKNIKTSSSDDDFVSSDIEKAANEAISTIVPEKSKLKYETSYKNFNEWFKESKTTTINETVMLAYFVRKLGSMKPSTLWCEYSKLRTMVYLNTSVDMKSFTNLIAYLKRESKGHVTKKSKTFTKEQIEKFLSTASDSEYLLLKTVLIVGVAGGCRREDLLKLSIDDVNDTGEFVVVNIIETKTKVPRQFVITEGSLGNISLLAVFRKYVSLRPSKTLHRRFFVGYRTGKCISQPVGINTFGAIPKKIAEFLGLSSPELYTGHCFRRSGATLLADSGAHLSLLKRFSGWKSGNVAEGYVDSSIPNKCKIAKRILDDDTSTASIATKTASTSASIANDNTNKETGHRILDHYTPTSVASIMSTVGSSSTSVANASTSREEIKRIISSQEVTITESTLQVRSALENSPAWPMGNDNPNLRGCIFNSCTINFTSNK